MNYYRMERKQTLGVKGAKQYLQKRIENSSYEDERKVLFNAYNELLPNPDSDPFYEDKVVLRNGIEMNSSKIGRKKLFNSYKKLCIGNTREPIQEENTIKEEPNQESSNDEWLRLTKESDFTKDDRNEEFSIKISGKDRVNTKTIASLFHKYLFPELGTDILDRLYKQKYFWMIKNQEYYNTYKDEKRKEYFYRIEGTPYYYKGSSRSVSFQSLSTLFKEKLIPFPVYFSYKPSLEKRRKYQLRNSTISYQYNP